MNDAETLPEADRLADAPPPRETAEIFGQGAAEAAFLAALSGNRLHHAWLITGPRGVGKATLAWRIARFLLTEAPVEAGLFGEPEPPRSLDSDPGHPVNRRLAAGAEPRLCLVRRAWDPEKKRLKSVITVDEVRKLRSFFGLSVADGGRRVVIVDSADEMNVNAANALLKVLEEPPQDTVMLLVSHQPARLLPTIRSRCRELRCAPLGPGDMARALAGAGIEMPGDATAVTELAGGSVGTAVSLVTGDGAARYAEILGLFANAPALDRPAAIRFADAVAQRGQEEERDLAIRLIELFLSRLARYGAGAAPGAEAAPGEAATLARLAPDAAAARRWAALHEETGARMAHGLAVNLDPSSLILDMVLKINETAAELLSRR